MKITRTLLGVVSWLLLFVCAVNAGTISLGVPKRTDNITPAYWDNWTIGAVDGWDQNSFWYAGVWPGNVANSGDVAVLKGTFGISNLYAAFSNGQNLSAMGAGGMTQLSNYYTNFNCGGPFTNTDCSPAFSSTSETIATSGSGMCGSSTCTLTTQSGGGYTPSGGEVYIYSRASTPAVGVAGTVTSTTLQLSPSTFMGWIDDGSSGAFCSSGVAGTVMHQSFAGICGSPATSQPSGTVFYGTPVTGSGVAGGTTVVGDSTFGVWKVSGSAQLVGSSASPVLITVSPPTSANYGVGGTVFTCTAGVGTNPCFNGPGSNFTSYSSAAITAYNTSTFTLTVSAWSNGTPDPTGASVGVVYTVAPVQNWIIADVNTYSGTSLNVTPYASHGSGTFTDWALEWVDAPGQIPYGAETVGAVLGDDEDLQFGYGSVGYANAPQYKTCTPQRALNDYSTASGGGIGMLGWCFAASQAFLKQNFAWLTYTRPAFTKTTGYFVATAAQQQDYLTSGLSNGLVNWSGAEVLADDLYAYSNTQYCGTTFLANTTNPYPYPPAGPVDTNTGTRILNAAQCHRASNYGYATNMFRKSTTRTGVGKPEVGFIETFAAGGTSSDTASISGTTLKVGGALTTWPLPVGGSFPIMEKFRVICHDCDATTTVTAYGSDTITGSFAVVGGGMVLTVTSAGQGVVGANQLVAGSGIPTGVVITGQLTGSTGSMGTYSTTGFFTAVSSESMSLTAGGTTGLYTITPSQTISTQPMNFIPSLNGAEIQGACASIMINGGWGCGYFQYSVGAQAAIPLTGYTDNGTPGVAGNILHEVTGSPAFVGTPLVGATFDSTNVITAIGTVGTNQYIFGGTARLIGSSGSPASLGMGGPCIADGGLTLQGDNSADQTYCGAAESAKPLIAAINAHFASLAPTFASGQFDLQAFPGPYGNSTLDSGMWQPPAACGTNCGPVLMMTQQNENQSGTYNLKLPSGLCAPGITASIVDWQNSTTTAGTIVNGATCNMNVTLNAEHEWREITFTNSGGGGGGGAFIRVTAPRSAATRVTNPPRSATGPRCQVGVNCGF